MSGSRRYFQYRTDEGLSTTVVQDESNSEATVGGVPLMLNRTSAHPLLSSAVKKRYVLASVVTNPDVRRKFWVGNPAVIPQIFSGAVLKASVFANSADTQTETEDWSISFYQGESHRISPAFDTVAGDTGLTDGDRGRDQ